MFRHCARCCRTAYARVPTTSRSGICITPPHGNAGAHICTVHHGFGRVHTCGVTVLVRGGGSPSEGCEAVSVPWPVAAIAPKTMCVCVVAATAHTTMPSSSPGPMCISVRAPAHAISMHMGMRIASGCTLCASIHHTGSYSTQKCMAPPMYTHTDTPMCTQAARPARGMGVVHASGNSRPQGRHP